VYRRHEGRQRGEYLKAHSWIPQGNGSTEVSPCRTAFDGNVLQCQNVFVLGMFRREARVSQIRSAQCLADSVLTAALSNDCDKSDLSESVVMACHGLSSRSGRPDLVCRWLLRNPKAT
jgi:hypothetical protein